VQDRRPYYIFYEMTIAGPQVLPGTYTVQVDVPGAPQRVPVTVMLDPRNTATAAQLQGQYDALMELAAMQARVESSIADLVRMSDDIAKLRQRTLAAPARDAVAKLEPQIAAELDQLRNSEPSGYRQPARLSEQIAYLRNVIGQYDGPPTQPQQQLMVQYRQQAAGAEAVVSSLGNELRALQGRQ
jgi:hypothetical protein